MSEIWENDDLREKLKRLSPALQEAFMKTVEQLYLKESEVMLSFIEESRFDMKETAEEIRAEQEALRDTSALMLFDDKDSRNRNNSAHGRAAVNSYLKQRGGALENSLAFVSFEEEEAAARKKKKKKDKKKKKEKERHFSSGSLIDMPLDDIHQAYAEETDEILRDFSATARKHETERSRQADLVREKKEKRKQKQKQVAELFDQAKGHEEAVYKEKERHEAKFKEKLEEKRKQKQRENSEVSFISTDSGINVDEESDRKKGKKKKDVVVEDLEDYPEVTKKKDKKKKKEEKLEEVLDMEEDTGKKKDKKKKKKEKDVEIEIEPEGDVEIKKKKKKKKKEEDE